MNKRLLMTFRNMKARCYNVNDPHYKNYGGRGIKICDEWLNDYSKFEEWAFANGFDDNLSGKENSIDRIDVNGSYEPSNCRWVTMKEQSRNTTKTRRITFNNETKILADWGREIDMTSPCLAKRIDKFDGDLYKAFNLKKYKMKGTILQKNKKGKIIGRFNSFKEAEEKTGVRGCNISKVVNKAYASHTAGGYYWEWEFDEFHSEDDLVEGKKSRGITNQERYDKIVDMLSKGYKISEIANELGITENSLSDYMLRHDLRKRDLYHIEPTKEFIDLYVDNVSVMKISKKLGIDYHLALKMAKLVTPDQIKERKKSRKNKIKEKQRPIHKQKEQRNKEIKALYKKGWCIEVLSERYGICKNAINYIIKNK